jgi:phenylalanyl-tRNA synthetase beta chain
LLIDRDYQEVVTYSFVDPDIQKMLDPEHEAIALANPISSEMGVMRTSLWPGLLQAAAYNLNRQQSRIRIFESGLKFISQGNEIKQNNVIAGLIAGPVNSEQWAIPSRKCDFYDIKSDVEALLQLTGNKDDFIFEASEHPALHPGQSARVLQNNELIGWVGSLHPKVLQKQGISDNIYLFELDMEMLFRAEIPHFSPLSKYPSTRRDIAIVVDEQVTASEIFAVIRSTLPDQLQEIRLFDVYRGKGVDSGRKSLALGLILQESSRTLIDEDMDTAIEQVMEKLKEQFDATLRE